MERKPTMLLSILVLLLVTLPYCFAALQSDSSAVFGGFIVNQFDGYSYLAKMRQGWQGSWTFTLPFTPDPGSGVYLFLFYLFLGHLARLTGLGLIWVFHITRALAALALVWSISAFFRETIFPDQPRAARLSTLLAVLGSGLGWIAALAGLFTSDFWVSDAFPFLAAYSNPHFPLGFALILVILRLALLPFDARRAAILFICGLSLAIILPFALVVVGVICAAVFAWDSLSQRSFRPWKYIPIFAGGIPILLYQVYLTATHPALAAWNAQNITLSPPLWDFLISLSPALLLGLFGLPAAWRARQQPAMRLLLLWFVVGGLLVYVPFSLQRRFFMAYFIPVAGMAILGVQEILRAHRWRWLVPALFTTSLLTNVMLIAAGVGGVASQAPELFRSADELAAMRWIENNTASDALVLTGTQTGAYVPGLTGRRVIYGHAFETVNAKAVEAAVKAFFDGTGSLDTLEYATEVNIILVGPREEMPPGWRPPPGFTPAFTSGGVNIYKREPAP